MNMLAPYALAVVVKRSVSLVWFITVWVLIVIIVSPGTFHLGYNMVLDEAGVGMTLAEHSPMGDKGQRKSVVPLASK